MRIREIEKKNIEQTTKWIGFKKKIEIDVAFTFSKIVGCNLIILGQMKLNSYSDTATLPLYLSRHIYLMRLKLFLQAKDGQTMQCAIF